MLVTLQKESGLLTREDPTDAGYAAAWGWHCPDTGPDGTANCDPRFSGFFNQAFGMAKQWSRYRLDPERYRYRAGQTTQILWNVAESGCGSAPVTIRNTATASLYNYTPYQPNAAALAAYPGPGDRCSSYGNRNFFFLFGRYFGSTGGGPDGAVIASGPAVAVPDNRFVDPMIAGRSISAPTPAVAVGLAAGFSALGLPYVWGGGGSGAGPDNGCVRGSGLFNSCGTEIGFDCSGLTAFVLGRAGFTIPGNSTEQRRGGDRIGWDRAMPGDVVGFPGHVAIYLGAIDGTRFILESSWVGTPVHVTRLTRADADPVVYRFWAADPMAPENDAAGAGRRDAWRAPVPTGSGFVPTPVRTPEPAPAAPPTIAPPTIAPETPGLRITGSDASLPSAVPTAGAVPGTTTPSAATPTATPAGATAGTAEPVVGTTRTAPPSSTTAGGTPSESPAPTVHPTPASTTPVTGQPSVASCPAATPTPLPTPTQLTPTSTTPPSEGLSTATTDPPVPADASTPPSRPAGPPSDASDPAIAGGSGGSPCPAG
jgi:cell wall-associated NlpC family hydrolase